MRKLILVAALVGVATASAGAQGLPELSAQEIMRRVDENNTIGSLAYVGIMEIDLGNRVLRKEFRAVAQGSTRSFVVFVNPEDRGVRYLKADKNLWM